MTTEEIISLLDFVVKKRCGFSYSISDRDLNFIVKYLSNSDKRILRDRDGFPARYYLCRMRDFESESGKEETLADIQKKSKMDSFNLNTILNDLLDVFLFNLHNRNIIKSYDLAVAIKDINNVFFIASIEEKNNACVKISFQGSDYKLHTQGKDFFSGASIYLRRSQIKECPYKCY